MEDNAKALDQYTVNGNVWEKHIIDNDLYELWNSSWFCDDGDGVELYIEKQIDGNGGLELLCVSGIGVSKIQIDVVDFGVMFNKAKSKNSALKDIKDYNYTQQCLIIADYFCGLLCTNIKDF